jgi:hypothetical protein
MCASETFRDTLAPEPCLDCMLRIGFVQGIAFNSFRHCLKANREECVEDREFVFELEIT